MQGLRNSNKITKGESEFLVGNSVRVAVVVIWIYVLKLTSDVCLNLDDCFYGLALTRTLVECHFYASGTLSNRIYILFMSNPILNVNDNKRQREII